MENRDFLAYCGLYCKLCSIGTRVPKQAALLRETMQKSGYEYFGEFAYSDFKPFWKTLAELSEIRMDDCRCRNGCGDPECRIRTCAVERNLESCAFCENFPCEHINALAAGYPNLIANNLRIKEIGIDAWLDEQEKLVAADFCYIDER